MSSKPHFHLVSQIAQPHRIHRLELNLFDSADGSFDAFPGQPCGSEKVIDLLRSLAESILSKGLQFGN